MAMPVKIRRLAISDKRLAIIDNNKKIDISLIPNAKVGDWLLVHGNLAVNKISPKEAKNIFSLIKNCSHSHSH